VHPLGCILRFRLCARLGFSLFAIPGRRGITPAFGYGTPHPGTRGTLTLLINALPSAHYEPVRLLGSVHAGISALTFPGRTVSGTKHSRFRDLPVPAHEAYAHATGL